MKKPPDREIPVKSITYVRALAEGEPRRAAMGEGRDRGRDRGENRPLGLIGGLFLNDIPLLLNGRLHDVFLEVFLKIIVSANVFSI